MFCWENLKDEKKWLLKREDVTCVESSGYIKCISLVFNNQKWKQTILGSSWGQTGFDICMGSLSYLKIILEDWIAFSIWNILTQKTEVMFFSSAWLFGCYEFISSISWRGSIDRTFVQSQWAKINTPLFHSFVLHIGKHLYPYAIKGTRLPDL